MSCLSQKYPRGKYNLAKTSYLLRNRFLYILVFQNHDWYIIVSWMNHGGMRSFISSSAAEDANNLLECTEGKKNTTHRQ